MNWFNLALVAFFVGFIPLCLAIRIVVARFRRHKTRPAHKLPAEGGKQAKETLRVLEFADDERGRPVYWDARRTPHIAIAGLTGKGKTATDRTIIRAAIHGHWEVWIADPKRYELRSFRGHPGVLGIADDGTSITRMMRQVFDELHARGRRLADLIDQGMTNDEALEKAAFRPMLVVIDEVSEMVQMTGGKKSTAVDDLTTIARMGRSLDIHLLVSTQQFNASEALPTSVRRQCDAQLAVGRVGPNGCRVLEWSKDQDIVPPDSDPGVAAFVKASGTPARLVRVRYADPPRAVVAKGPGGASTKPQVTRSSPKAETAKPQVENVAKKPAALPRQLAPGSTVTPRPSAGVFRSGRLLPPPQEEAS